MVRGRRVLGKSSVAIVRTLLLLITPKVLAESSGGPDWVRYGYYARLIRTICHPDTRRRWWLSESEQGLSYHISPEVFELLSSRGPLPHGVKALYFGVQRNGRDITHLPALLHSNIKLLHITATAESQLDLLCKTFVELSQIRDFQLKEFSSSLALMMNWDEQRADAIAPFLESQKNLESLKIRECFGLGPRTVQAIVRLSNLRYLTIEWRASTVMETINDLTAHVSEGCPLLRQLRLIWLVTSHPGDTPFNFDNLYKWQLEVVELGIEYPTQNANPSLGDLRKMGKAWPDLKVFKINWANRSVGDEPNVGLPLSALDLIAYQWPNIVELNTALEWTQDPPAPTAQFKNLQELPASEWYIPQGKVEEVADYLMDLEVSPDALRHAGMSRQFGDVETRARYESSRNRWRAVVALMI